MPATVLAATRRRDGAIRANFCVGDPRNIDIFLRVLLLELHPAPLPSHTCLYMKKVLVNIVTAPAHRAVRPARGRRRFPRPCGGQLRHAE